MDSTPEAFQGSYGRIIMHYNNYTSGAFRSDTPSLPPGGFHLTISCKVYAGRLLADDRLG